MNLYHTTNRIAQNRMFLDSKYAIKQKNLNQTGKPLEKFDE